MEQLSSALTILSDPNRLRILKLLEKQPMCVCELAAILAITQPSVSRHLKKLKLAGFIVEEQDSLWTNYRLADPPGVYALALKKQLSRWLNADPTVLADARKARAIDRDRLCVAPRSKNK